MEVKNKKIVVTGGAGFIGSQIANTLAREGYQVHVIDTLVSGKKEALNSLVVLHEVDIRQTDAVKSVLEGADTVFHTAALPRVEYSMQEPVETTDVNVKGTASVLAAAVSAKVRRVVYSASSSAYGDQEVMPLTEDMEARPVSPYGLQKYTGELFCKTWATVYNIETVSLRYFNVYGPGQNPEGEYALVIGKFLKQRAEGLPLTITGDGEQTRDFTHVRDVVRANILAMDSVHVGNGEVINIGAGDAQSINSLADTIGGEKKYIASRAEPKHTCADIGKAKKLLGWEPHVLFKEGIKELL